jgi:hypothetical protein
LLDYEECTIEELEAFIATRHLNLPSEDAYRIKDLPPTMTLRDSRRRQQQTQERAKEHENTRFKAKKAAYITVLHEADDTAVFDKFLELPPEVRTIVYKKHYEDFPDLSLPHQPPLTLASKPLRAEALPIFYEHSTFVLRLKIFTRARRHSPFLSRPVRVLLHNTADDPDLLTSANLPPAALSRISRIHLCLSHRHTLSQNAWGTRHVRTESAGWDIDLNDSTAPVVDCGGVLDRLVDEPHWNFCRARLGAVIKRVLGGVWARPKAHKLRREDVEGLLEAVREALNPPVGV